MDRLKEWLELLLLAPLFVIRVRDGVPSAARGVVTSRFLAACGEILGEHGVAHGTVRGYRRGDGVSLRFSRNVPDALRQRVRNAWAIHR